MTRLKDATFEGASLTGTNGGSSVTGTVTLDATSKVKDTYSSLHNTAASFVRFDFTGVNEVFITALIKVTTFSANLRSFYLTNIARIDIRSNGALRLADSGGTQIGSDSSVLSTNTIYRIGIHYKRGVIGSGTDDTIEAYVAADGVAFGAAFASTTALSTDIQATRLDVGNTSGATANTWYADNIRIDDTAMPTDDVSGGTTTNKTISVTITGTSSIVKSIGKPISVTVTDTIAAIKSIGKPISVTIATARSIQKSVNKTIQYFIDHSLVNIRSIVRSFSLSVNVAPLATKNIPKTVSVAITTTVNAVKSKVYNIFASVTTTVTTLSSKSIGKPISYTITVVPTIRRALTMAVAYSVNTAANIQKEIAKTFSTTISTIASVLTQYIPVPVAAQIITKARTLTLSLKNTAAAIIGINSRTLTIKDREE